MFVDDAEPVLIFEAKMITDYQDDLTRQFLFRYYLNDQTIAIFEKKTTTGFQGGRFLNRMKVKNPQTQKPYDDSAIGIGKKVQVAARVFELVSAPDYTFCMMEANPARFLQCDLQFSVDALKAYLGKSRIDLAAEFAKAGPRGASVRTADAEKVLFAFDPGFPRQSAATIVRRFADGNSFDADQLFAHLNFE
jgi:hypothetical protein